VLIVGLADHDAGLPAALLALGVFSLHFATIVITNFRDDDAREQPQ
jgi:hypothetical protein